MKNHCVLFVARYSVYISFPHNGYPNIFTAHAVSVILNEEIASNVCSILLDGYFIYKFTNNVEIIAQITILYFSKKKSNAFFFFSLKRYLDIKDTGINSAINKLPSLESQKSNVNAATTAYTIILQILWQWFFIYCWQIGFCVWHIKKV